MTKQIREQQKSREITKFNEKKKLTPYQTRNNSDQTLVSEYQQIHHLVCIKQSPILRLVYFQTHTNTFRDFTIFNEKNDEKRQNK
jgi:hypothetical protein